MTSPEDDDDSSKTEEASERKISKSKEDGDVAVSQEVKTFIMLVGTLFVVWLVLPILAQTFVKYFRRFIEAPESLSVSLESVQLVGVDVLINFFKIMAIPFGIFMVLGVIASVIQTGLIFAPKKLEMKFDKLNFIKALPTLITKKKIVESLKGVLKIVIIASIGLTVLKPYLAKADLLPNMSIMVILYIIHKAVIMLVFTVTLAVFVLAILDFLYQKFSHLKKLRMTKQEVKEEYKQSEGDPMLKSKIRQLRYERAHQRMMDNLQNADVIITNPTHYAVALEYKIDTMGAPKLIAKGVDHLALRIREFGEENDIPVVENPPLARALFASVELDDFIPGEHFKAVAEVIGYVMQLKK